MKVNKWNKQINNFRYCFITWCKTNIWSVVLKPYLKPAWSSEINCSLFKYSVILVFKINVSSLPSMLVYFNLLHLLGRTKHSCVSKFTDKLFIRICKLENNRLYNSCLSKLLFSLNCDVKNKLSFFWGSVYYTLKRNSSIHCISSYQAAIQLYTLRKF